MNKKMFVKCLNNLIKWGNMYGIKLKNKPDLVPQDINIDWSDEEGGEIDGKKDTK